MTFFAMCNWVARALNLFQDIQDDSRLEKVDRCRASIESELLRLQTDVTSCRAALRHNAGNAALAAKLQLLKADIDKYTSTLQKVARRQHQ